MSIIKDSTSSATPDSTGHTSNTSSTHSPSRPLCRFFNRPGGCRDGDHCQFRHVTASSTQEPSDTKPKQQKTVPLCRFFDRPGGCRDGDRCRFRHESMDPSSIQHDTTIKGRLTKAFGKVVEQTGDIDGQVRLHVSLIPSDPDFSFDLNQLDIELTIRDQDETKVGLCVLNPEIPKGIARNLEVAFQRRGKQMPQESLVTRLNWLNASLENLLQLPTASTLTFVRPTTQASEGDVVDKNIKGDTPPVTVPEKPSPPVVHSVPDTPSEKSHPESQRRQFEVQQIERRFRSSFTRVESDSSKETFSLQIKPTDPDFSHPYPVILIHLCVPYNYPQEPFELQLRHPEIPRGKARNVERACAKHVSQHPNLSMLQTLNWLDRRLEELLHLPGLAEPMEDGAKNPTTPLKDTKQIAPTTITTTTTKSTTPSDTRHRSGMADLAEIRALMRDSVKATKKKSQDQTKTLLSSSSLPPPMESLSSDPTDPENVTAHEDGSTIGVPVRRGTQIRLLEVQLDNVEFLQCLCLNLMVRCGRCRNQAEVRGLEPQKSTGKEKWVVCGICKNSMGIRFRSDAIHANSDSLGFLDLDGCFVFDLLPSTYATTCGHCSAEQAEQAFKELPRGQPTSIFCRQCHHKMTLTVSQVKFQRLAVGLDLGEADDNAEVVGAKQRKQLLKDKIEGFTPGQSLPDKGACKHYRRSHRWMRFPCCGKVYPCDVCHDKSEDHDHERAKRMICGYCSLEQPFSQKPCPCGASLVKESSREFWEGGTGMRDPTRMNRKDPHKFRGLEKTISRKKAQA